MRTSYELVSGTRAKELQEQAAHRIAHGSEGECPNCGHFGVYDLKGVGVDASSIFYSMELGKWCCVACGIQ